MAEPHSVSDREQVVDTMIGLTRLTNLHRAIVARPWLNVKSKRG
jgi:hypothetical protein